jgi:hypothetical protein
VPDKTGVMMYFGGDDAPDYSRRQQSSTRICF